MKKVKPYNGKKFYNGTALLGRAAEWNACIGRRANGKSFWWLHYFIIDYFDNQHEMAYIRRLDNETRKKVVDAYFADDNLTAWLKKSYDMDGIYADAEDLYFFKYDDKGKKVKAGRFGHVFAVNTATKYKSLHFDKIYNVLYEEFITDGSYIDGEWKHFNSILSTIFRLRRGRVVLIGNTVSRSCPYFREMGVDIQQIREGTITDIEHTQQDGHKVTFSVEYCADIEQKNKMFFGKVEKQINSGAWETEAFPHLFFKLEESDILYTSYYIQGDFCFRLNLLSYKDHLYIYIYPYKADRLEFNSRDDIFFSGFTTKDNVFNAARKKRHEKIWPLFEKNKALFSDDLCGTEFYNCLDSFNPF